MEAKDTVMTSGEIVKRLGNGDNSLQIAKAQAEISFKAGETVGYNDGFIKGREWGKKVGIREVVEFTTREFGVDWSTESGQLRVWGVDKP